MTDEEEGLTEGVDCQTWDPDCGAGGGFSGDGPPPGRGKRTGLGLATPLQLGLGLRAVWEHWGPACSPRGVI